MLWWRGYAIHGAANIDPRMERDYGDLTFGRAVARRGFGGDFSFV